MNLNKTSRFGVELRAADTENEGKMIIEGKAVVFDSATVLFSDGEIDFKEIITKSAFENTVIKDCALKYNHDNSQPILARMRGGSLSIDVKDDGVYFRAELFDTQFARDVYTLIRAGALQCSFAFIVSPDGEEYDNKTHTRTITSIERLIDVSVVTLPAYSDTWVKEARAAFDSEEQKELMEIREREAKEAYEQRKAALLARLNERG